MVALVTARDCELAAVYAPRVVCVLVTLNGAS
jgi:hypothetical protein